MIRTLIVAAALALSGPAAGAAAETPAVGSSPAAVVTPEVPQANDDAYLVPGASLVVQAADGVLANDHGRPLTVVRHGEPAHGTLSVGRDGSFTYTPQPGYAGPDSFTYGVSNAVQLFPMDVPPLGTVGAVPLSGDGYGSSLAPVPGAADQLYALTDRGPNVFLPDGTVIEPLPAFQPSIGRFRLRDGEATLEQSIPLADHGGAAYSGRANSRNTTGQRILDLSGTAVPADPNGSDPEGLVALPNGTFWVADEYGPFLIHFDAAGHQIGRLSPFDGSLPGELANRVANRGLEGLTLTPDGSTLVAIMQSALLQRDLGTADPLAVPIVRIVTYGLESGQLHEYLYLLDDPATNNTAVSEIAALSNTSFVVDERDGKFPPGAYKKLWRIDLSGATDVGPNSAVAAAFYDGARGGLLIGGHSLEALVAGQSTAAAAATLAAHGITPASKTLALDLGGLLDGLDPSGGFFPHDKVEGLSVDEGAKRIVLSNDSDFGVGGVTGTAPPFELTPKVSPATGSRDTGEFLIIDTARLPAEVSSATVTLYVGGMQSPTETAAPARTATRSAAPITPRRGPQRRGHPRPQPR